VSLDASHTVPIHLCSDIKSRRARTLSRLPLSKGSKTRSAYTDAGLRIDLALCL